MLRESNGRRPVSSSGGVIRLSIGIAALSCAPRGPEAQRSTTLPPKEWAAKTGFSADSNRPVASATAKAS